MIMALDVGKGSASCPGRFLPPRKDPVLIVQEAGWAAGPVWTGAGNFVPTGIRSPELPARSQSLYTTTLPSPRWYFVGLCNLYFSVTALLINLPLYLNPINYFHCPALWTTKTLPIHRPVFFLNCIPTISTLKTTPSMALHSLFINSL
jgi:hypothetical protein